MAGDTVITVVGNLTGDPELRFTPSGAAVANFTVASTPRAFDRQSNEWKDGDTLFMRCSIWREAAENVAESLPCGTHRPRSPARSARVAAAAASAVVVAPVAPRPVAASTTTRGRHLPVVPAGRPTSPPSDQH
jgi:hypothetical protein